MKETSLMQRALGVEWSRLPVCLQAHYQPGKNRDVGRLSVEYPGFMRPVVWLLGLFGVLISRYGNDMSTTVYKNMRGENQIWQRRVYFPGGKKVSFDSEWVYAGGNKIIEFVNPFLGLCMSVHVDKDRLYYEGKYVVVNCGLFNMPVPEWLFLGHTTIIEQAVDDTQFKMDFRLIHPWFGQLYRYNGLFTTESM